MRCPQPGGCSRPSETLFAPLAALLLVGAAAASLAGVVEDRPGAPVAEAQAQAVEARQAPIPAALPARKLPPPSLSFNGPKNASQVNGLYTVEKQGTGVYYRKGYVQGIGINVIEADLSDPEVRVGAMVARGGIGASERFSQMVNRARPAAAITGTFFGIRNRLPTGDLVINGQPVFRGFIGTAVAITEGNVVSFVSTQYKDQSIDWSLFDTVIRGGPRLVEQGQVALQARGEGFRTLAVAEKRTRTAVGLTRDNHLQFVAVRQAISLWDLAKVMKGIGAYHAVALDGGTSTAMYFAGRHIARPGRDLTNVLMIYHRRDRFESARQHFGADYAPRPLPPPPTLGTVPITQAPAPKPPGRQSSSR
jgi:hypothetical protein